MYLHELSLHNFRSFSEETISFQKLLTVLVGENNGGKSNIIDAIRLLSVPSSGRRDLYCERTDVRFGVVPNAFTIQATFQELSAPQQGRLLSAMTDESLQEAKFGLTYDVTDKKSSGRPTLWAGRFKATPEKGSNQMIRHVYLPPLRDAKRALASGHPTRIHTLLNHFLGEQDPEEVAKSLARTSRHKILSDVDTAVGTALDVLTSGVRRQRTALGFNTDEKLIDIARDLRFKLGDYGITPEDLQYSGHGFANLLYIATIAVELERTDNAELTMFLVEEPEAHLHPQLQAAVLNFLEERAEHSLQTKTDKNAPAGHIQVIVATHSPNLSAWVPSKLLVFLRSVDPQVRVTQQQNNSAPERNSQAMESPKSAIPSLRLESRCVPLAKLDLSDEDRRKIDRYLDATKSALLFGGRALLVEGIAETILLPVMAKVHLLRNRPVDFRKFRSTVLVPIDGVDFMPYIKVLLSRCNGIRIADRVVVITDGDKHTVFETTTSPGEQRKASLETLAKNKSATNVFHVFTNTYSLETELISAGNETCMREIFLTLHPRSRTKWDDAISSRGADRAKSIQKLFESTPKGDFAQLLAEKISHRREFIVPNYIREAVEAVIK